MNTPFKKKLEEERALVISELKGVGIIKDAKDPENWVAVPGDMETDLPDENETADRIESYEENTALVTQLETRLREIDAALTKIDTNTYGLCEVCNKQIEQDRLEANPAAPTCKEHMKK